MNRRAIVVGAGIGGAASALLLARVGFDVVLLERAAGPEPGAGTAIGLHPNGLAVLYGLGLREPLQRKAHLARAAAIYLDDRLLVTEPFPHFSDELDHMLVLHRSRLAEVLHDAVQGEPRIDMRYGTAVTDSADVSSGKVTITSEATLRADVVVGADGAFSRVREGGDFGPAPVACAASLYG